MLRQDKLEPILGLPFECRLKGILGVLRKGENVLCDPCSRCYIFGFFHGGKIILRSHVPRRSEIFVILTERMFSGDAQQDDRTRRLNAKILQESSCPKITGKIKH